jgi:hypothetical protein
MSDLISKVRQLHSAYEARTGYAIRLNMYRERQWAEWLRWSEHTWTEADLARVIGYLRSKISKGERNEGALKFDNLIGSPDKFEEDLNLAKEASRGTPVFRPKQRPAEMAESTAPAGDASAFLDGLRRY